MKLLTYLPRWRKVSRTFKSFMGTWGTLVKDMSINLCWHAPLQCLMMALIHRSCLKITAVSRLTLIIDWCCISVTENIFVTGRQMHNEIWEIAIKVWEKRLPEVIYVHRYLFTDELNQTHTKGLQWEEIEQNKSPLNEKFQTFEDSSVIPEVLNRFLKKNPLIMLYTSSSPLFKYSCKAPDL